MKVNFMSLEVDKPFQIINANGEFYVLKEIDDYATSPRNNSEVNLGVMVCWHRRYLLGDENRFAQPENFIDDLMKRICGLSESKLEDLSLKEKVEELEQNEDVCILPVFLQDHSSLVLSTRGFNDPWDSGQVGWIYTTKKLASERWGKVDNHDWKECAYKDLNEEVNIYNEYLAGNNYMVTVYRRKDNMPDNVVQNCVSDCDFDPDVFEDEYVCGLYGEDNEASGLSDFVQQIIS